MSETVKELEWEECRLAQKPRWQAQAFMRQYYEIDYDEEYETQGIAYYADPLDDTFPTLEAAKAACQADFAQRITSALVQPSGVVSADALLSTASTFLSACLEEFGDPDNLPDDDGPVAYPDSAITFKMVREFRAAITAALASPVSEGEISPTPDIPRDEPTVRVQIHGGDVAGVDESIAPLVKLLNDGGVKTAASCSGHGQRPGNIALADGRELIVARNWKEARLIDGLFLGINGEPARGADAAREFICQSNEEIRAKVIEEISEHVEIVWGDKIADDIRSLTNGDG